MHNSNKNALLWCNRIYHPQLRVHKQESSTLAARMMGAWLITYASQHHMRVELIFHTINLNSALMQLASSCQCVSILVTMLCLLFIPPLRSGWFSTVDDSPGYGLSLYQGVDIHKGFYASNNPFCILLECPLSFLSMVVCFVPPAYFKMSRLR